MPGIVPEYCPPYFETGSLIDLELIQQADMVDQWLPRSTWLCLPNVGDLALTKREPMNGFPIPPDVLPSKLLGQRKVFLHLPCCIGAKCSDIQAHRVTDLTAFSFLFSKHPPVCPKLRQALGS